MENINWYPGHMKKTRELIGQNLGLVDAVVEVCDARIPVSSRNPVLDELLSSKGRLAGRRLLVLNKSDLADEAETRRWTAALGAGGGTTVLSLDAMRGAGVKRLVDRLSAMGVRRLMIVGVPNAGKSSLINRLAGRRTAAVGDRPGVTRGKQWLTLPGGMQLLDTPGILWPKFEDPQAGLNLAFCGSIRDEIMDLQDLGFELVRVLLREYPALLSGRYGVEAGPDEAADEALGVMDAIGRRRGFLLAGGRVDLERVARTVLDEFRAGKIGRVTLEKAPPARSEAESQDPQ
ncbi:MAG: ribosome biogenesis GTPase YlqF [Clostridiales Family XIII bacterium]|jgi:ribosome biogenesis GTPase A|nr:ribosome biogenesis GTPase YlqF [Clostridiales Family XIII bacterium]